MGVCQSNASERLVSPAARIGAHEPATAQPKTTAPWAEQSVSLGHGGEAANLLDAALKGKAPRPPHIGKETLLDTVASGAIRPLSGRWLVAHEAKGGRIERRQDLPDEAFWSAAELRRHVEAFDTIGDDWKRFGYDYGLLFVALSYRWLSAEHPDPDRFHLKIVAAVARLYMKNLADAFQLAGLGDEPDFALFWDFASLYQRERTADEEALFLPGLQASNVWYGHQLSVCWMQTELPAGFAERMLAMGLAVSYIGSGWVSACTCAAALALGVCAVLERWCCRRACCGAGCACAARRRA